MWTSTSGTCLQTSVFTLTMASNSTGVGESLYQYVCTYIVVLHKEHEIFIEWHIYLLLFMFRPKHEPQQWDLVHAGIIPLVVTLPVSVSSAQSMVCLAGKIRFAFSRRFNQWFAFMTEPLYTKIVPI